MSLGNRIALVVVMMGAALLPAPTQTLQSSPDPVEHAGDGHESHEDKEGQIAALVSPSFNESGGCDAPAGVITPASTTNSTANRALPSGHQVRGPWGDFFGRDYGDVAASMVNWTVPMSGGKVVKVHERALPAFRRVAENLAAEQARGRYYSARMAASWVWRRIGGLYRMSTHSFGTTIDINWDRNPFRSDNELITDMPQWYVDAWKDAGFCWGGDWQQIKDPMHFSWKGPRATAGYGTVPAPYPPNTTAADFTDRAFAGNGAWGPLDGSDDYDFVDANRDAAPDLVRLRRYGDDDVLIEYARSSGDFRYCATGRYRVEGGQIGTGERFYADFDGDARPDLWALDTSGSTLELAVFRHAKRFERARRIDTAVPVRPGAEYLAGDYDRDGRPDLYVVIRGSQTRVEVWSGNSKFTTRIVNSTTQLGQSTGEGWQFSLGDHDVDGRPDIYAISVTDSVDLHVIRDNQAYTTPLVVQTTAATGDRSGRYAMGDYDGDGRSDLLSVLGGGRVNVHLGGNQSGSETFWFQTPDHDCSGFGPALLRDFNGDRKVDVAVGAPREDLGDIVNGGVVNVLYGGKGGPRTSNDEIWWQDAAGIEGVSEEGDRFGSALAGGDFNGDGYGDIAIGAPSDGVGPIAKAGVVNVIYGDKGGLRAEGNQQLHQDLAGIPGAARAKERLGSALAAADFDGDGRTDLAIGIPRDKIGSKRIGSVAVLYGTRDGLDTATAELWNQDTKGIRGKGQAGDAFGSALAAGDIDGDGFADLAIGAPLENRNGIADAGTIHVLYGSKRGLKAREDQRIDQDTAGIEGQAETGDRFGASLAIGDFDSDGNDDLAVGAPGDGVGSANRSGRVAVLYGTRDRLTAGGNQLLSQGTAGIGGAAEAGDAFGAALSAGDIDDDGFDDLVVGVPREDIDATSNAGAINVLMGSAAGLGGRSGNLWFQGDRIKGNAEKGDRFGGGVFLGDLNGDGYRDIVIGIPGEDLGAVNAGAFAVIYGTRKGPSPTGNQVWHQDTNGVEGQVEAGDSLGKV